METHPDPGQKSWRRNRRNRRRPRRRQQSTSPAGAEARPGQQRRAPGVRTWPPPTSTPLVSPSPRCAAPGEQNWPAGLGQIAAGDGTPREPQKRERHLEGTGAWKLWKCSMAEARRLHRVLSTVSVASNHSIQQRDAPRQIREENADWSTGRQIGITVLLLLHLVQSGASAGHEDDGMLVGMRKFVSIRRPLV